MTASNSRVLNSSVKAPQPSLLSRMVSGLWGDKPRSAPRRMQLETLEQRLLLSADISTPGLAVALEHGLDAFSDRVQDFIDAEPLLNAPLPIVVTAGLVDDEPVRLAASIKDLLLVPVDQNNDGDVDVGTETDLEDLDDDVSGTVDFAELFGDKLAEKLTDVADGLAAYAAAHPADTLADYFNQSLFDTTVGPLEVSVTAVDTSDAHEVSADLDITLSFVNLSPIDLGFGADDLGFAIDTTLEVTTSLEFELSLGALTSGEDATDSDFFIDTGTVTALADANVSGTFSADANVGFLGVSISGGTIDLTAQAHAALQDPHTAAGLGFTSPATGTQSITGNVPPPSVDLAADAQFYLRIGSSDAREIEVAVSDNSNLADLIADVQSAVNGAGFTSLVGVDNDGGSIRLSLPASLDVGPLDFGNEVGVDAGGELKTASAVATNDASVAALTGTSKFLLAVDHDLPVLLNLDFSSITTVAGLLGAINSVINPKGAEAVQGVGGDAGKLIIRSQGPSKALQITRSITIDSKIGASDLEDGTAAEVFAPAVKDAGSTATVTLPIAVQTGLGFAPGGVSLSFSAADSFSPGTLETDADGNERYDLALTTANFTELLNFNNMSASTLVGMLNQLGDWLDGFRQNEMVSGIDIPLTTADLGDLLDFAEVLRDALIYDDDAATTKLLDENNALQFQTAQELATRLDAILPINLSAIAAAYDSTSDELTYSIEFSHALADQSIPLDFNLDLTPLAGVSGSGTVTIAADGTLSFTFGAFLGAAPSSELLTGATLLSDLFDVAEIKTDPAVTGPSDVRTIYGRLVGDGDALDEPVDNAVLTISFNGGADHVVTVTKSSTNNNLTVADLAADFNTAFTTAGIAAQISASVDPDNSGRVKFTAATANTVDLTVDSTNPAARELGVVSQTVEREDGVLEFSMRKDAPRIVGRLTADQSFDITIGGGSPVTVTVDHDDTTSNKSILDLINDVQLAVNDAGLTGQIEVKSVGNRLVFTGLGSITDFTVTAAGGNQLGLATGATASNNADFEVVLPGDGSNRFLVTLDGATTVQDVINAIETASGNDNVIVGSYNGPEVEADISTDGTALVLTAHTAASGKFSVQPINGSWVALFLGIVGETADETAPSSDAFRIEGSAIGGLSAQERFFVEDATIEGSIALTTPGGVEFDAQFGFVGVHADGNGTLGIELSTGLKDPGTGTLGARVTLDELLTALTDGDDVDTEPDIATVVATPTISKPGSDTDFGEFTLDLTLDPAITLSGFTLGSPQVVITVHELDDINVTTTGSSDLYSFDDIGFDDILQGLQSLASFLQGFETFGFLSEPIPVINRSLNDLLSFAGRFSDALDELESNPAGSLQLLEAKLKEALGLETSSSALALSLDEVGGSFLKVGLALEAGFDQPLSVDFTLPGMPLNLGGSAGLNASGSIALQLDVGIDLNSPTQVFLYDSSALSGELDITGDDLTFRAAVGPAGIFITDGSITIGDGDANGNALGDDLFRLDVGGTGFVNGRKLLTSVDADNFTAAVDGAVAVNLPVYFPTDSTLAGFVKFDAEITFDSGDDGFNFSATPSAEDAEHNPIEFTELFTIDPSALGLLDGLLLGVDGLDIFLGGLQDAFDGEIGGFELPLIGDKLSQAATFIEDLREGFIADFRDAVEDLAHPTADILDGADPVSQVLFDLLGPSGLNVLAEFDPDADGDLTVEIEDIIFTTNLNDPDVDESDLFVDWEFRLGGTLLDVGGSIGFDLGVPALGIETDGEINLNIDWELAFGFGLNFDDGFYINISDDSELEVNLSVTTEDPQITGRLGFLQLTGEEDDDVDHDTSTPEAYTGDTHLTASFTIDLKNGSDASDEKLGFSELGRLEIDPHFTADAAIDLALTLALNDDLFPGAATSFPSIVADFTLLWEFDSDSDSGSSFLDGGLEFVGFEDVGLDLGSFLEGTIGSIVDDVQDITEPLQPIIDVLTTPIPVISDLAGPTTLLDIAEATGFVNPAMIAAIETIAEIVDLVNSIDTSGDMILYFGDFTLFEAPHSPGLDLGIDFSDPDFDFSGIPLPAGFDDIVEALGPIGDSVEDAVKDLLPGGGLSTGFSFPLLDHPDQLFGVLLGQPATLVQYDMAPLEFDFKYKQFFPIIGPLGVSITGEAGATIDFLFGYDTEGIRHFAETGFHNPALLLDGFFVGDRDPASPDGEDVNEMVFTAGISAAAEINIAVASAGVSGGIFAEIDFNLHDPNDDGRVRIDEIVNNFMGELLEGSPALAPLAIFDVEGRVFAKLFAFLEVDLFLFSISFEQDITPEITLLDFEIDFARPPVLATVIEGDSSVLQLNMGQFADMRLEGDDFDIPEDFTVSGNENSLDVTAFGVTTTYTPADGTTFSKIIAFGGEGDDTVDATGVTGSVQFEFEGGAGDDTLKAGAGAARILGGTGDDDLWGGDSADVIFGEQGNDTIHGGDEADKLFGDGDAKESMKGNTITVEAKASDGKDTIFGQDGQDIIFGAGGVDTIEGGDQADLIIGDGGMVTLKSGIATHLVAKTTDGTGAKDILKGNDGNDRIYGGQGNDEISGGNDDDTLYGEVGFDVIDGDADEDTIYGGTEKDTINGGSGADTIYGEAGNDLIHGNGGDDYIDGGTGADTLYGDDGADHIYGRSEPDKMYGGDGDDYLEGGLGNDLVYGGDGVPGGVNDGSDTLVGGIGSDTLDGETNSDEYLISARGGTTTELTTAYDTGGIADGFDRMTVNGTSADDVFLLRAMADAYLPSVQKLIVDKLIAAFNSGADDPLEAMTFAIQTAYGPNPVPAGMIAALEDAYNDDPTNLFAIAFAVFNEMGDDPFDTAFVALLNNGGANVERFNYRSIEGVVVNGLIGNDYMVSDDNIGEVTLNGGPGNDRFQVGQVFRSPRGDDATTEDVDELLLSHIDPNDVFATIAITRGWLSNGITFPMTINGGSGDDEFTVFHNLAVLTLNGGDDNDLFTVRSFALEGSTDSQRARTDMKGDSGADTILYAYNAPVGIDGGDGFDTIKVIGTEFSDDYVVTFNGIFGAGRYITYVNVEQLTVDGAEGDDRFFVLSTNENVVTEIQGGLGSDTFFVAGNPTNEPIPVLADDLRGHSGIVLNSVEATGTNYDNTKIEGISANIADDDQDYMVVRETGGVSVVTEGAGDEGDSPLETWGFDRYFLVLTRQPEDDVIVQIGVPEVPPEETARGYSSLLFWDDANDDGVVDSGELSDSRTLTFTSSNWDDAQEVRFVASQDDGQEGTQFVVINHQVKSTDTGYNALAIPSVKVQINDDDKDGVIITPTGNSTLVFEASEVPIYQDTYKVVLTHQPSDDVLVHLDPINDQVTLSSGDSRFDADTNTITFTDSDWSDDVEITITAIEDGIVEGFHTEYITHTVTSDDEATTESVTNIVVDGDLDLAGEQAAIPADKPVDMLLLEHKPLLNDQVVVKLDGNALDPFDPEKFGLEAAEEPTALLFDIDGSTLAFLDAAGNYIRVSGAVTASYQYTLGGYDGATVDRVVAKVADEDAPGVVIIESDGSTDVMEDVFLSFDTFQVVLTMAPTADVTIDVTPKDTRSTRTEETFDECDPINSVAYFQQQVDVFSSPLTFHTGDWFNPQTVFVVAKHDDDIDGNLTQVFAPTLYTVNDIRGPLFLEGAAGEGSIELPEPLVLPGELNEREADGDVLTFVAAAGFGATETMTVNTAELEAAIQDHCVDGTETLANDLVGKTIQIATGPGIDRFWQITAYVAGGLPGTTVLTLQNPTQVNASTVDAPTAESTWTLNALSENFFVNEEEQVDFTMIFDQDSVADDVGLMSRYDDTGTDATGTFGDAFAGKGHISGLGMGPSTTIGGFLLPGGITYNDQEVVRLDLGQGNDDLTVTATTRRENFYTLTIVNTGLGNDEVTVDLHPETDGAFSLDTQEGDDIVDASDSTLGLVIFGGDGDDQIHGGQGDDYIFGDQGRIDYVNNAGEIITRLGTSIDFIPTDKVTSADEDSLTDSDAAFPTTYGGLVGLVVSLIPDDENIDIQFRTIESNTANTITVTEDWDVVPDGTFSYRISFFPEDQTDTQVRGPRVVWSVNDTVGGEDHIWGEGGADTIVGGAQGDVIRAGAGDDFVAGDNVRLDYVPVSGDDGPTKLSLITPMERDVGGADGIEGNEGNDVVIGGTGADGIDGGTGFDLLFGDNAVLVPRFDTLTPLVRTLAGATLFNGGGYADNAVDNAANVTGASQPNAAGAQMYNITLLDHASGVSATLYGNDTMAGGADGDMLFGELGNDLMLGDASVNPDTRVAALGQELVTDGDDYIEGNGGADTIYGNLGQDDILGGSSTFFGLSAAALRLDGNDVIYGGAGTDTARNFIDPLHARDADVILGDNGQIFRIVDGTGAYRTYNYDLGYAEPVRIIPRSWNLLDYTPGTGAVSDIAGVDRIFGESGNDIIHGMGGDDILFGDAGDDDLYGGAGNDWMSGGSGVDGMLGDDGRIFTSRNGLTEPLNGITAAVAQQNLATQGNIITATINVTGELTKYMDLEPYDDGGNDIMYGGLGDDFMHGGAGVDGMSGAEALGTFYADAQGGFGPGHEKPVLVFNEATGRFQLFDNTQPLKRIEGFFLNFAAAEQDGNDRLFGDVGNDWLVGGTNSDHLYGGFGNDLLNLDDNLDTNGGLNNAADADTNTDIAFGGGGTDQLIGNTQSDRMVDWAGEFNGYWVPFSPFGTNAVNRIISPGFPEFLYAMSKADGADQTRVGTGLGTAARNGEPFGELGLVLQQDPFWHDQTGGPTDPQPGNGKKK